MIIANRLSDGLVVFFAGAGAWARDIEKGALIEADGGEASLQAAKADEAKCLVVDPQLIEVTLDAAGRRRPTAIREAIRAFGPSAAARTDRLGAH